MYLAIALGSALGGMARHWVTMFVTARAPLQFPLGTFAVNVVGALLIGVVMAVPPARLAESWRQFLAIGVMGGFTTFSAFSMQTLSLIQSGKLGPALAYMLGSVALCLIACAVGWWVGSQCT